MAYGRLGWKPPDLMLFDFKEFSNALSGFDKVMQEKWAMARQIGAWSLWPNSRKGARLKGSDLLPLPIDKNRPKVKKKEEKYAVIKKLVNGEWHKQT